MTTHETPPVAPPLEVSSQARAHLAAAQGALKRAEKSLQAATRTLPEGVELKAADPGVLAAVEAIAGLVKPPPVCKVQGCGRPVRVYRRRLCQTHYKHWRLTGKVVPIRPVQPRRAEVAKLSGLSLSPTCVEEVTREANARGVAPNAMVTDVLEEWGRRFWARERARQRREGQRVSKPEQTNSP